MTTCDWCDHTIQDGIDIGFDGPKDIRYHFCSDRCMTLDLLESRADAGTFEDGVLIAVAAYYKATLSKPPYSGTIRWDK